MKIKYMQSAREFLEVAGDDLLRDEIRHGLAFGIAEKISDDSRAYGPDDPWFIAYIYTASPVQSRRSAGDRSGSFYDPDRPEILT